MGQIVVFLVFIVLLVRFLPPRGRTRVMTRVERISAVERDALTRSLDGSDAGAQDCSVPGTRELRAPAAQPSAVAPMPSAMLVPGSEINVGYGHRTYRCARYAMADGSVETHVWQVNRDGMPIGKTRVYPKPMQQVIAELAEIGRVRQ